MNVDAHNLNQSQTNKSKLLNARAIFRSCKPSPSFLMNDLFYFRSLMTCVSDNS